MKLKLFSVAFLAAISFAQAQSNKNVWTNANQKNVIPLESRMQLPTKNPVSYTHLDVYKRQSII